MDEISVTRSGSDYSVIVGTGSSQTTHTVTIPDGYPERLGLPSVEPEALIRASFEFLLAREPASSILSRFELSVIERYFPEYPAEVARTLS